MNTLITGVAGSGKTTIAAELTKRGYYALNMDSINGLCSWINLSTGKSDPYSERISAGDWFEHYDWLWNTERLTELLKKSSDTFFCGSSGNQEQFYRMFGKIFLLEMDKQLIKERIFNNERDHNYGRRPGELELIFSYFEDFQDKAKASGATVINARKPVDEIIDVILSESGTQLK